MGCAGRAERSGLHCIIWKPDNRSFGSACGGLEEVVPPGGISGFFRVFQVFRSGTHEFGKQSEMARMRRFGRATAKREIRFGCAPVERISVPTGRYRPWSKGHWIQLFKSAECFPVAGSLRDERLVRMDISV